MDAFKQESQSFMSEKDISFADDIAKIASLDLRFTTPMSVRHFLSHLLPVDKSVQPWRGRSMRNGRTCFIVA